jgi:hypothetical protein
MNRIASAIARRGIWAGAPRRLGVSEQVADQLPLFVGQRGGGIHGSQLI